MEIEAAKVVVEHSPLPTLVENKLRQQAKIRSSHYSTFIEGNRLTIKEAGAIIENENIAIKEKERDVSEVRNYWNAWLRIEEWVALMAEMVAYFTEAEKEELPVPLIAALIHYHFVTIHPFYDGNGRTARLLATFILQRGGYGLNGIFSLERT